MTAEILRVTDEHHPLEVAKQEYDLAKQHFREVLANRRAGVPEHEQRFRDALDRQSAARDKYVACLMAR